MMSNKPTILEIINGNFGRETDVSIIESIAFTRTNGFAIATMVLDGQTGDIDTINEV